MAPSISVREYIHWASYEKSEPTATLVLTSSESRFVDIRILLAPKDKPTAEVMKEDVLPTSRLEWAFAGTSSSELIATDDRELLHTTWKHWVDSTTTDAESVRDEGDMYPQPNGRTLERGRMVNPATGRETEYEECWRDIEAKSTTIATHSPSEAVDGGEGKGKVVCAVLLLHDDENQARGMVVRVGQFCQGVLRVGNGFSLERWMWETSTGWKRQVRIGDLWLPCGVLMDGQQRIEKGGEVRHGDFLWRVVEVEEL